MTFLKETSAVLRTGSVSLTVHLPDQDNGIYRGPRFDWSSNVSDFECDGHSWFAPWKHGETDPTAHDQSVIGIGGEFGRGDSGMAGPLAYASANPGDTFLKIGVGELLRPDTSDYRFFTDYKVARPAKWKIDRTGTSVSMTQQAGLRGYGYRYNRTIVLDDGLPGFKEEQSLENIGDHTISQYYYDHNFINVDQMPPGPAWRLELPFVPVASLPMDNKAVIEGNMLRITNPIPCGALFAPLTGFGRNVAHNRFILWNDDVRQGLSVEIDKPLEQFALFAAGIAVCPEPFIHIHLASGEQFTWRTNYALKSP